MDCQGIPALVGMCGTLPASSFVPLLVPSVIGFVPFLLRGLLVISPPGALASKRGDLPASWPCLASVLPLLVMVLASSFVAVVPKVRALSAELAPLLASISILGGALCCSLRRSALAMLLMESAVAILLSF